MKLLVETTGQFMLVDAITGDILEAHRPSVVRSTSFITARATIGQVGVIHNQLPEEASDEEFAKFWRDSGGDKDLAVDSYLASLFPVSDEDNEEAPKPQKGKRGKKG